MKMENQWQPLQAISGAEFKAERDEQGSLQFARSAERTDDTSSE